MEKLAKWTFLFLLLIFSFAGFLGCPQNIPESPSETPADSNSETPADSSSEITSKSETGTILLSKNGESVTFDASDFVLAGETASFEWFTVDGDKSTEIVGATSEKFTTESFSSPKVQSYLCKITQESVETEITFYAAYTGLPFVSIATDCETQNITRTSYTESSISIFQEGVETQFAASLKGRGNTSWGMPKKGYNIKFSKKKSLFELSEAKKWCLIANYSDKTLLRNKFASVLGNEIFNAVWNPSFVSVDLELNGEYVGNYTLAEKISLTKGRIDVQDISDCKETYTDQNGDSKVDLSGGGFILEVDVRQDADFYFVTEQGVHVSLKDPDKVSDEIFSHIQKIVQNAEDSLYSENSSDETNDWRTYIDEESVIDWYLVNEFTKNNDAVFFSSVYMYYDPQKSKLCFGPNWDFDISCGNINYNDCDNPEGFWINSAGAGTAWTSKMFDDSKFTEKVKARWNDKKSALQAAVNNIQTLADEISVSADLNFVKWQILGIYVWPNAPGYEARTTYQSEVSYMIDFLNKRFAWLDTAINNLS